MFKKLLAICIGTVLLTMCFNVSAQGDFKPQLQKVTVNGQILYEVGTPTKTLDLNVMTPLKFEYTFVNKGSVPATKDYNVFVHFNRGNDIAGGGDYTPSIPSSQWTTGKLVVDVKDVNFADFRGQTVNIILGFYNPIICAERFPLANEGLTEDLRLPVGKINAK